jgi:hypothetical protein
MAFVTFGYCLSYCATFVVGIPLAVLLTEYLAFQYPCDCDIDVIHDNLIGVNLAPICGFVNVGDNLIGKAFIADNARPASRQQHNADKQQKKDTLSSHCFIPIMRIYI